MHALSLSIGNAARAWLFAATIAITTLRPADAIETMAREALLVDMDTGAVLLEKNADRPMPPASMSKIMTTYIVFSRLREGKLAIEDTLPVSERAWRRGGCVSDGSTMCLKLGERAKVEDLLQGIIVQSGNDASMVIAEGLAGSEEAFASEMNNKGKEMGLKGSVFRNSTGLPEPDHVMTARDLAILAERTIRDFPDYYRFYGEKEFTYNGIKQGNRNPLLYKNVGADGLKTGHTKEAGYGLTASAKQGERRVVLVVTGLPSMAARAEESTRLIEYAFREFENVPLVKAGEQVETASVWLGEEDTVPLQVAQDVLITMPRRGQSDIKVAVVYDGPVPAPLRKGDVVGKLSITAPGISPIEMPLVAGADIERRGPIGRAFAALGSLIYRAVP
jgi:serine-type D-Ala-D-Ala carboxypeptidase (penicillin-binding protein 5/6)